MDGEANKREQKNEYKQEQIYTTPSVQDLEDAVVTKGVEGNYDKWFDENES